MPLIAFIRSSIVCKILHSHRHERHNRHAETKHEAGSEQTFLLSNQMGLACWAWVTILGVRPHQIAHASCYSRRIGHEGGTARWDHA
jgi:hypothetical protein